jgi:hypothetical protein
MLGNEENKGLNSRESDKESEVARENTELEEEDIW